MHILAWADYRLSSHTPPRESADAVISSDAFHLREPTRAWKGKQSVLSVNAVMAMNVLSGLKLELESTHPVRRFPKAVPL